MTIRSIQKVIKIGSSAGVTIPAKDLQHAGIKAGDNVEVLIRKPKQAENTSDAKVIEAARSILDRYHQDFKNLADR